MLISGKEHPFKLQMGMEAEEKALELISNLEIFIREYVMKNKNRKTMDELETVWKEVRELIFEKPSELPHVRELDSGIMTVLGASFIVRALSQIVSAKRAQTSDI